MKHKNALSFSDPKYITGVHVDRDVMGSSVGDPSQPLVSPRETLHIASHGDTMSIDVEVTDLAERNHLVNALTDIVKYLDDEWFDKHVSGDIDFHDTDGNGANSYYFHTNDDIGVHEFSFTGEDVTEEDIRSAVGGMIAEMKENDLL